MARQRANERTGSPLGSQASIDLPDRPSAVDLEHALITADARRVAVRSAAGSSPPGTGSATKMTSTSLM